ncbi:exodeoxyribonuclease VII large subunit [Butyricicoccus sp. OF27-2pH9A]|uniref:exodeoxyribonuclease VII large subunit n=1 Tax=Butyricicoccus sp. OF27-2pH9A TaxID=3002517 RepID=UPI0022E89165|nr:exodeoxyribonuclease VII large subunit [Butyricicoccus sp. OF27-2pH9A]
MATIYTVSQLNNEIKDLLDTIPGYRGLMVQGEISNYKAHSSGHHYMTLKDENAAINAVMFRSDAMRLKFRLQNGMKVIVKARVSSFPRTGAVQLYVSEIIPDGAGALNLAFEQLKAKLQAEGLFSERYKKPIPTCPNSIALVTSPTGAAVRDMIRILGRRWPLAKVVLYPAQVQGQGAAESIARAIALANAIGEADVILCGRGGGSMEDLWAFNEEVTARAIFDSEIPVISAVGHEPDFTIADFVADLRAPTPSGAAELAVPDRAEYALNLRTLDARLHTAAHRRTEQQRKLLDGLQERLSNRTPMKYIEEKRLLLTQTEERLLSAVPARLETERNRLNGLRQRLLTAGQSGLHRCKLRFAQTVATLDAMSPLRVLGRGYAVATKGVKHTVVTDAAALKQGDTLHIQFAKGAADCRVTDIEEDK